MALKVAPLTAASFILLSTLWYYLTHIKEYEIVRPESTGKELEVWEA